ncbi:MAG TPA: 50S ribosomal protein L25 [Thermomicrobiales bacterium]|nr:50S ribosomal protein L25 [Thermomicrobiales bacterium]
MANEQRELGAERRELLGKQVSRLRRAGRIPGVVYGPVIESTVPVSVDRREFLKFYQANGHSTLFVLRWEGGEESVFIREVQEDPLRREPLHIDFFAPNLRNPVRAMVPIVLHNPVSTSEAVLTEARTQVEVEALPMHIPSQIDLDVSGLLRAGDLIRVGDLTLPPDVTSVTDADEVVVQMEAVYRPPVEEPEVVEAPEAAIPEPQPDNVPATEASGGSGED